MARQVPSPFDWALWFYWIMATTLGWILGRFLLPNLSFVTIGIALGVLQWFLLQRRFRNAWRWILATTFGWTLGATIILLAMPDGMEFLAGLITGMTTGTAQWLVLRREVHWAGWWILINIVAWTTGMALLPGVLLTGIVAGLITATAMTLLLIHPKPHEDTLAEDEAISNPK
jgi:hypothetical protein